MARMMTLVLVSLSFSVCDCGGERNTSAAHSQGFVGGAVGGCVRADSEALCFCSCVHRKVAVPLFSLGRHHRLHPL